MGLCCDIRVDPSPPVTDSDTGPARDHAAGCGRARLPGLPATEAPLTPSAGDKAPAASQLSCDFTAGTPNAGRVLVFLLEMFLWTTQGT